jgi:hypothetical protein
MKKRGAAMLEQSVGEAVETVFHATDIEVREKPSGLPESFRYVSTARCGWEGAPRLLSTRANGIGHEHVDPIAAVEAHTFVDDRHRLLSLEG